MLLGLSSSLQCPDHSICLSFPHILSLSADSSKLFSSLILKILFLPFLSNSFFEVTHALTGLTSEGSTCKEQGTNFKGTWMELKNHVRKLEGYWDHESNWDFVFELTFKTSFITQFPLGPSKES